MDPAPASGRATGLRRRAGFIVGVLLFAAAVFVVASEHRTLAEALVSIADAPWWLIAAALALPVASWTLTSLAFWILTRRFGPVGLGEMHALIASAWLLNYLPLRPGLVGRIGYHRAVNGIPVKHSVRVLAESVVLGGLAIAVLLAVALAARGLAPLPALLLAAAPAALALAAALPLARAGPLAWRFAAAWGLKYADMLAWAARYAVVFALLGAPIDAPSAVLIAAVSQLALLVPFTGNGLGLREWAVGVLAPVAGTGLTKTLALSGDLLNRAIELAVAVPLGLAASVWLAARMRRAPRPAEPVPVPSEAPEPHAAPTRPPAAT